MEAEAVYDAGRDAYVECLVELSVLRYDKDYDKTAERTGLDLESR